MYKKICPTCNQKSFSSCQSYHWDCPICQTDLTLQSTTITSKGKVEREYPTKKQLSIFINGWKINQQA